MSARRDRSVVRSSVIPSAKYCWSGSLLRLAKGNTTIDSGGAERTSQGESERQLTAAIEAANKQNATTASVAMTAPLGQVRVPRGGAGVGSAPHTTDRGGVFPSAAIDPAPPLPSIANEAAASACVTGTTKR